MKEKRLRSLLKLLVKTAMPLLCTGLCICITLGAMECFGSFFNKITVISAAAAMPKASLSYGISKLNKNEDVASLQSEQIKTQEPAANVNEKEESNVSSRPASVPDVVGGKISEYSITPSKTSSKIVWYKGAAFSNTSGVSNSEILKILKEDPKIKLAEGKPQVLIYHTHSTESYEMKNLGYYEKDSSARTRDNDKNMIRVGKEIVAQLESAGIEVIHDTEIYDYPSYNGAYNRSAATVKKYLEKYPSITITLDIHRDAIEQAGGVRVKPTATINGKKAAQVMIIAGVDDGSMNFPNWKENMKFASALQCKMEEKYSGLTRAAMVCHRRYNMYLTRNSLLIEVGGHANTLDEAIYSGEMIGKSLVDVLKEKATA